MNSANTEKPQIRAACYLRISSDPDDKRAGVTRQKEDTATMCEVLSWLPPGPEGFYEDNNKSASNGASRKDWSRLLADVKKGMWDAIVVWNQDRGWRKMAELESLRPQLEPLGVLLATTNLGVIDFRNADDVFRVQISTAMSEMEVEKMRVRQRRAAVQRAQLGIPKWKHAFGYIVGEHNDDCPKKCTSHHHQLDPKTAPLVVEAYNAIKKGEKLKTIAAMFNDADAKGLNGKPWTESTVSLFLRNPRNCALRAHNGVIVGDDDGHPVKGTWPELVSESLWRAAQAKLNAPGRAPGPKSVRQHILTSVMLCGNPTPKDSVGPCDGVLAGNWQMQKHRGGPRAHAICYRCKKCQGVSIREEHVLPLLYQIVGGRLAMKDAEDLLKDAGLDEREAEAIRDELSNLYGELDAIGIERGKKILTGRQAQLATEIVQQQIDVLERKQQSHERLALFEDIPLGRPEAVDAVKKLSADRFRAVINVLMTVTIMPVGKGSHVFDERRVVVEPKGGEK